MPSPKKSTRNFAKVSLPKKLRNHHVFDELRSYIIENNLQAGDPIPTEQELSDRFRVSRISVREATKALSLLGLLSSTPRRGTIINEPDIAKIGNFIGFHFASSNHAKHDLLELRLIIEVGQLKHAMVNMTEKSYEEIINISNDLEVTTLTRIQWLDLDMRFHTALLNLGGNNAIRSMANMLRKFFTIAFKEPEWHRDVVLNEHRMIAKALYEKNLELAQGLLHQHLQRSLILDKSDESKGVEYQDLNYQELETSILSRRANR